MLNTRMLSDDGLSPKSIGERLGGMHEYKVKLLLANRVGVPRLRHLLELCEKADTAIKLSPQGYIAIEHLICSI